MGRENLDYGNRFAKNPFLMSKHLSTTQKIKVFTNAIFILPLRFTLMCITFGFAGLLGFICNFGIKDEDLLKPFTGWRRFIQHLLRVLSRFVLLCLGFHWIKVKGQLASSKEAPIVVVAPHSTFIDGLLSICLARLTFLSRKENDEAPVLGHAVRAFQPVYVTRGHQHSRNKTVQELVSRATSGGNWPQICVFPEGTCTNGKSLITFKSGAFYPGVPVQPVIFRLSNKTDCLTWTWIGPSTLTQLIQLMCQFHNSVEVEVLPVYTPGPEERKDAVLYAENVRIIMATALNVPVTKHSFDDCRLMTEAKGRELPPEAGLVEYCKTSAETGIGFEKMRKLLEVFSKIDENRDGLVTIDEFGNYLNLPLNADLKKLFGLFDKHDYGYFDFKRFLYGYSALYTMAETKDFALTNSKCRWKNELGEKIDSSVFSIVQRHLFFES